MKKTPTIASVVVGPAASIEPQKIIYPTGVFKINDTKVVFIQKVFLFLLWQKNIMCN